MRKPLDSLGLRPGCANAPGQHYLRVVLGKDKAGGLLLNVRSNLLLN